jgi:hypothetical protein
LVWYIFKIDFLTYNFSYYHGQSFINLINEKFTNVIMQNRIMGNLFLKMSGAEKNKEIFCRVFSESDMEMSESLSESDMDMSESDED